MTIKEIKEKNREEFEKFYSRTIGIIADEEIMSGKYAEKLLSNKKDFLLFLSLAENRIIEGMIEMIKNKTEGIEEEVIFSPLQTMGFSAIIKNKEFNELGYIAKIDAKNEKLKALQDLKEKLEKEMK